MFYNIRPNCFKVYWFRLKTIKSGQNQLSLADAESYAFKSQSLLSYLYTLLRTQHLPKVRFHGSRDANWHVPVAVSWCRWKDTSRHRPVSVSKSAFPSRRLHAAGSASLVPAVPSQSTSNLLWTSKICSYYTSLRHTRVSTAHVPHFQPTLDSLTGESQC